MNEITWQEIQIGDRLRVYMEPWNNMDDWIEGVVLADDQPEAGWRIWPVDIQKDHFRNGMYGMDRVDHPYHRPLRCSRVRPYRYYRLEATE